jgi:hypothetical protein
VTRKLQLRAVPPAPVASEASAVRYDIADGPLVLVHSVPGATNADRRAMATRLQDIVGTVVVMPAGWGFEVFETPAPESVGPRACPSCGQPRPVDGCPLCEVGGRP